jgi:hypothetical protein
VHRGWLGTVLYLHNVQEEPSKRYVGEPFDSRFRNRSSKRRGAMVESPVCPNCGEELQPEDLEKRSCSNCGANLEPHSPQSEPAGP